MNFADLKKVVEAYKGLLDQDGWETTSLTIREEHPEKAEQIIALLKKA